jgi:hypothetical protein
MQTFVNTDTIEEIKNALESIVTKINDNGISAWNSDLADTTEAVAIEDHYGDPDLEEPSVKYNGWLDDLENLIKNLGELTRG